MSLAQDPALDPSSDSMASGDPRPAAVESELATTPKDQQHESSIATTKPTTYTEMASNAATSATNAASGMTNNVFSMFGGGAKREKKEVVDDDVDEPSGSSKAKKDTEEPEVSNNTLQPRCLQVTYFNRSYRSIRPGRSPRLTRSPLRACGTLDREG